MMRQVAPPGGDRGSGVAPRWSAVLRALREAAGVTQEGWAARLGYGRRTIQRWEHGDGPPDAAATEALVRLCGDLRLYRPYRQGALAGLTVTAELVRGLLAEARLEDPGRPAGRPETPSTGEAPAGGPGTATARSVEPAHNLPAELDSFVGRERERAEVGRLLESTRLLTLTGAGGAGKTRLALRVTAELLDRYTDGAWLAELATLAPPARGSPALVPQAVAGAVGVREQPGRALDETLIEALDSRRLLLVLDNCEHLTNACAALAARLLRACPQLRILTTSREPLGVPGEVAWPVPPLALPEEDGAAPLAVLAGAEAVRLFVERASAARPGFALTERNAAAVARICRRLDGLPLAIELAAARVRALAPGEIATRLDDRFRLLVGGGRASPPRHQTLRAAIDWSYDLLDGEEQRLFDRLSVFAGSFTLAAAETVCADAEGRGARREGAGSTGQGAEGRQEADAGLDERQSYPAALAFRPSPLAPRPSDVLDLLARLVDRSLVVADVPGEDGETRYRLLETLRTYGAERLGARGEADRMRRRHAAWVVALAEQAHPRLHGPEQGRWLRRVEREHADVRAALDWALERGDADTALRLGAALGWAWGVHGRRGEGRAWLERALALPGAAARTPVRARVSAQLAVYAIFQGDFAAARSRLDEADVLGRELGDATAVLAARGALALLFEHTGALDDAWRVGDEALALARRLGDAWWEGRLLETRAHVALRRGDAATAAALLEEGVRLARRTGDTWGLATALAELGDLARSRGAHADAGALYAESLTLREGLGLPGTTPSLRHNLGYVALATGDASAATAQFAAALREFRRLGERRGVAECVIGLAGVAAAGGWAEGAARLFGAGEAALEALGSQLWPSNRADYERAVALARAALDTTAFEAARAEGRGLSLEEAIALALDRAGAPRGQGRPALPEAGCGAQAMPSRSA